MAAKKTRTNQRATQPTRRRTAAAKPEELVDNDLSPAQRRELERRIADLRDRARYMLLSTLGLNFVLYYNVSDDTYGWNDPTHATLFKRRKAAEAVARLIGDKDSIVSCRVDKHGKLVKRSIVLPSQVSLSKRASIDKSVNQRPAKGRTSAKPKPARARSPKR
jgi:hypothetical protein